MAAIQRVILVTFMAVALFHVASAISGQATFYTEYVPSSCYGFQNQGVMIAAAPENIFNHKAACGRHYQIRCTSGTNLGVAHPCRNGVVTVKVVDLCPGCQNNQFDLSQEAFNVIADPNEGRINIDFIRRSLLRYTALIRKKT